MSKLKSLPVKGYIDQRQEAVDVVNVNKELEERVLRWLDQLAATDGCDGRWFATGRTSIEQGFMAINRSVFKPERISLPEDDDA